MLRRTMVAVALLTAGVLVAAGCGDDEERLTEEEFLEQGNTACAEGNEEIEALFAELPQDEVPTEEQIEPLFDDLVDAVRGQVDAIDELSPPEELEDDVDQLVSDARDALEEIEDGGPSSLLSEDDPFAEVNEQAADLGLTECA
jgi:hypothetical protein